MSKHDENRERTKQNLKNAFWELYREKSINEITIRDITDMAGCHRATFYLYYSDIYDLLSGETEEIISYMADMSSQSKELSLSESIEILTGYFETYGDKLDLLLGARYNDDLMTHFKEIMYPRFRENLGMKDTLQNEIICEYAIQGMQSAFRCWYKHRNEMDLDQFTELVQHIVRNGLEHFI